MSSSKSSSSDPGSVRSFLVEAPMAGMRLDKLLSERPEIASREMARRLIDQGAVRLNTAEASPDRRVRFQDRVEFLLPAPQPIAVQPEPGSLEILYEDAWLVVVNKPAGVMMHPGAGRYGGTLVNYLLHHCRDLSGIGGALRPGIVHRLDKDTSGVVVVAKNDQAHLGLARQFKERTIERAYLAIVLGDPVGNAGTIDLPIGRHPRHRLKRTVTERGKPALTRWEVIRRASPFVLLRLRLGTGRTHQIRVHLASKGWPVVGDPLYGGRRYRGMKLHPEAAAALERLRHQALHAEALGFDHPQTGAHLHFQLPPPAQMQELIDVLFR